MNFSQLNFGLFSLNMYGMFLSFIFVFCSWYYYRQVQKRKLSVDFFVHHYWRWALVGVLVGRVIALVLSPHLFAEYGVFALLIFWEGGINIYGFALGFLAMMAQDVKSDKADLWKWIDNLAIALLIGFALEDLAGFLTGGVYGTPTSLPWAIQYETFGVETINPVHPVTIYSFILHLLSLYWVTAMQTKLLRQKGNLFKMVIILILAIDFVMLFFTSSGAPAWLLGTKLSQWLDLMILMVMFGVSFQKNPT